MGRERRGPPSTQSSTGVDCVWAIGDLRLFDALTERLSGVFDRLSGRGVLSEKDIDEAMREVRVALLEADVALPVVRDFIHKAKEAAAGEAGIRAATQAHP